MKRLILIAALFAVSGCATFSKEEIAGCKGDELCISGLIEQKEYEREDARIVRYEKALVRYENLKSTCPGGSVTMICDAVSKGCGRAANRKNAVLSYWELRSAGCTANVIWH